VLSAKRINFSAAGGAPTIHPIATGSLSRAVSTGTSADVTEPSLIVVVFIFFVLSCFRGSLQERVDLARKHVGLIEHDEVIRAIDPFQRHPGRPMYAVLNIASTLAIDTPSTHPTRRAPSWVPG
jgi:hypothetical protein